MDPLASYACPTKYAFFKDEADSTLIESTLGTFVTRLSPYS